MATKPLQSITFPELDNKYTVPVVDNTLTTTGAAADAKKVGDEITSIKEDLSEIVSGLSEDAKQAMLACFRHLSFLDNDDDYYTNLYDALYPDSGLVRIETVFNQGTDVIYDNTPLNDLKAYLTVTGYYNNGTSKRINDYTLSGTLEVGTSIITVSAEGKTTTFNVAVTSAIIHLRSYVFAESNTALRLYNNNARACSTYVSGEHPYPKAPNAESLQGDYYPIPIPQGVSSINVTMPNDLYVGIRVVSWIDTYYATDYSGPWLGVNDATLDVSDYNDGMHFVALSYKSGSAGTTDMTNYDMSGVEITFL